MTATIAPETFELPQHATTIDAPAAVSEPARVTDGQSHPQLWRWESEAYHRLSEQGFFNGRRVELIKGEIIEMAAMNGPHWAACKIAERRLERAFTSGFTVTCQLPLKLQGSEPQPDVMVVPGEPQDYVAAIPTMALLIVEVSVSTLPYDRGDKLSLYAEAQIPEYWLLDVDARQLEVYRRPIEQTDAKFGWSYGDKSIYTQTQSVAPLAAPTMFVSVQELLP